MQFACGKKTRTNVLPSTYVEGFHNKENVLRQKYRTFLHGELEVSILALGTSSFGNVYQVKMTEEECIKMVIEAIKNGINYIDTAPFYGLGVSETILGKALQNVPRQAYIISTKTGRLTYDVETMFDFSSKKTIESINLSLQRLRLDYIDIAQVHDPEFAESPEIIINETLPALNQLKQSGKIRHIGLTGFPFSIHKSILDSLPSDQVKIDTCLFYCHYTLQDTSLMTFRPYIIEKGIDIINASPIAMGLLSNDGPPEWHPASKKIKDICQKASDYCKGKNVDISKLAIYFALINESLPTTLCSATSVELLHQNLNLVYNLETALSQVELEALDEIRTKFFIPLNNESWEGFAVERYWKRRRGECTEGVEASIG